MAADNKTDKVQYTYRAASTLSEETKDYIREQVALAGSFPRFVDRLVAEDMARAGHSNIDPALLASTEPKSNDAKSGADGISEEFLSSRLSKLRDEIVAAMPKAPSYSQAFPSDYATASDLDVVKRSLDRLSARFDRMPGESVGSITLEDFDDFKADLIDAVSNVSINVTHDRGIDISDVDKMQAAQRAALAKLDALGAGLAELRGDVSGIGFGEDADERHDELIDELRALGDRLDDMGNLGAKIDRLGDLEDKMDELGSLDRKFDGLKALEKKMDGLRAIEEKIDGLPAVDDIRAVVPDAEKIAEAVAAASSSEGMLVMDDGPFAGVPRSSVLYDGDEADASPATGASEARRDLKSFSDMDDFFNAPDDELELPVGGVPAYSETPAERRAAMEEAANRRRGVSFPSRAAEFDPPSYVSPTLVSLPGEPERDSRADRGNSLPSYLSRDLDIPRAPRQSQTALPPRRSQQLEYSPAPSIPPDDDLMAGAALLLGGF